MIDAWYVPEPVKAKSAVIAQKCHPRACKAKKRPHFCWYSEVVQRRWGRRNEIAAIKKAINPDDILVCRDSVADSSMAIPLANSPEMARLNGWCRGAESNWMVMIGGGAALLSVQVLRQSPISAGVPVKSWIIGPVPSHVRLYPG